MKRNVCAFVFVATLATGETIILFHDTSRQGDDSWTAFSQLREVEKSLIKEVHLTDMKTTDPVNMCWRNIIHDS
jgi:hypothetical protein